MRRDHGRRCGRVSASNEFLRELIQDAAQRLMDIEVAAACGAGYGDHSPNRDNHRNGCVLAVFERISTARGRISA